jgi:hypothetical protein
MSSSDLNSALVLKMTRTLKMNLWRLVMLMLLLATSTLVLSEDATEAEEYVDVEEAEVEDTGAAEAAARAAAEEERRAAEQAAAAAAQRVRGGRRRDENCIPS